MERLAGFGAFRELIGGVVAELGPRVATIDDAVAAMTGSLRGRESREVEQVGA